MRIISFTEMWPKLSKPEFTTYRFPRKDFDRGRDWHLGENLWAYYRSRSPARKCLGVVRIVDKSSTWVTAIDYAAAVDDGFPGGISEMTDWLEKAHKCKIDQTTRINKLTLQWLERSSR